MLFTVHHTGTVLVPSNQVHDLPFVRLLCLIIDRLWAERWDGFAHAEHAAVDICVRTNRWGLIDNNQALTIRIVHELFGVRVVA